MRFVIHDVENNEYWNDDFGWVKNPDYAEIYSLTELESFELNDFEEWQEVVR